MTFLLTITFHQTDMTPCLSQNWKQNETFSISTTRVCCATI